MSPRNSSQSVGAMSPQEETNSATPTSRRKNGMSLMLQRTPKLKFPKRVSFSSLPPSANDTSSYKQSAVEVEKVFLSCARKYSFDRKNISSEVSTSSTATTSANTASTAGWVGVPDARSFSTNSLLSSDDSWQGWHHPLSDCTDSEEQQHLFNLMRAELHRRSACMEMKDRQIATMTQLLGGISVHAKREAAVADHCRKRADKAEAKVKALNTEHRESLDKLRQQSDAKCAELRQQLLQVIQEREQLQALIRKMEEENAAVLQGSQNKAEYFSSYQTRDVPTKPVRKHSFTYTVLLKNLVTKISMLLLFVVCYNHLRSHQSDLLRQIYPPFSRKNKFSTVRLTSSTVQHWKNQLYKTSMNKLADTDKDTAETGSSYPELIEEQVQNLYKASTSLIGDVSNVLNGVIAKDTVTEKPTQQVSVYSKSNKNKRSLFSKLKRGFYSIFKGLLNVNIMHPKM